MTFGGCAGAVAAALLGRLREDRSTPRALSDLLQWAFLVAPQTVLQKNGALLTAWRYRGPDSESSTPEELAGLSLAVSDALRSFSDRWMLHADYVRRPAGGYAPRGAFSDPVTAAIDEERRRRYEQAGQHFESEAFLLLTFWPAADIYSRLGHLFIQGRSRSGRSWEDVLATFERRAEDFERSLSSRLKLARLGSDELLAHLHSELTGLHHPVATPPHGSFLDLLLADQELQGGWAPKIGARSVRVVALHGFPAATTSGSLDFLGDLGFPFRVSHRLILLGQATAGREIRRIQLNWFRKRKGATAWLREMFSRPTAVTAHSAQEDLLFRDWDAAQMAEDAAHAAQENSSGKIRFCFYTPVVVISDPAPAAADYMAAEVVKALGDHGFPARVETINSLEALRGSLAGHGFPNLRRNLFGSRNIADLLPLTSVWPGLAANPSPYFPPGSPPLFYAATSGSTPFRVNFYHGDVAHTLIIGPTGSGKSTLVNFCVAQFFRYPDSQVFAFDLGLSSWILAKAAQGVHHFFGTDDEPVELQPLAGIDRQSELAAQADWLETVLQLQGLNLTPERREALHNALRLVATSELEHRTLTELVKHQLQNRELRTALEPYTIGGTLGFLLDGSRDSLATARYLVFELSRLMDLGPRALLPVLLHLFHRVEQRLDGRPTMIVIEEAWLPLMNSVFAARIKEWLLTLRKRNAGVVLVTQSLSQLAESAQRLVILESCPTRILLANPQATSPSEAPLYRDLGLNATQIGLIANARRKRDYYFTSPDGNRLFELGLDRFALAFLGTPDGLSLPESIVAVKELMRQHGPSWPRAWLAARGLESFIERLKGGPLYAAASS